MASNIKLKNNIGNTFTIEHTNDTGDVNLTSTQLKNIRQVDTIADLRAMTDTQNTIWVSGYHTKDDGAFGSHIFRWNPTSTEDDNGGTIIKLDSVVTGRYELRYSGAVNVKWFGAKGDGITNDTVAIQSAINTADSFYYVGLVEFSNRKYKLSSGLILNPQSVNLKGNGTQLDFSSMVSGTAIWARGIGTVGASYADNRHKIFLSGIKLLGNSNLTAIDVYSDSLTQDTRGLLYENFVIDTFNTGINIAQNGWGNTFSHYAILNTLTHINEVQDSTSPEVINFGECNSFNYGMHSGSEDDIAYISRNYNSDAYFNNCSFDLPRSIDVARGAKVTCRNIHIETQSDRVMFKVEGTVDGFEGAYISLKDSIIVLPGTFTRNNPLFEVGVDYSVGNGGLDIDGLYVQGVSVAFTNNVLIKGNGRTSIENIHTHSDFKNYMFIESGNPLNQLADGGFDNGIDRWTSVDASYPPTHDTTVGHYETGSLKMTSVGTAIVGAYIERAVVAGDLVDLGFWYKLNNVTNGGSSWKSFDIFVKVYDEKGNVLSINEETYLTGTSDWTFFSSPSLKRQVMPTGASKIKVQVALYQSGAGSTAWIDDVTIAIIK